MLWGGLIPSIQVFLLMLSMSDAEKFYYLFYRPEDRSNEVGNIGSSTFRSSDLFIIPSLLDLEVSGVVVSHGPTKVLTFSLFSLSFSAVLSAPSPLCPHLLPSFLLLCLSLPFSTVYVSGQPGEALAWLCCQELRHKKSPISGLENELS